MSCAGPDAVAVTVGTDSEGNVLVGGLTYFVDLDDEDGEPGDGVVNNGFN